MLIGIGAMLLAPQASGTVHKCSGPGGTPVYQGVPCAPGSELRNFESDPPALSVVPGVDVAALSESAPPRGRAAKTTRPHARPTGRATSSSPQRDASARRFVHAGMSEAEVLTKLGRPDVRSGSARKGGVRWSYLPAAGDPQTITSIIMERGVVADVERKLVKR